MGNSTQRGPKVEKVEQNGSTSLLRYGVCEMQGWRSNMEDATIAAVDFDGNTSVFGVMDGHGGSTVSKFVANNFVSLFTHMKSYKQKNYEQALIETYLKFDELLRLDKVNVFLHKNSVNRKDSRLDITFSYGLQPEFGGRFSSTNYDEYLRSEEAKEKEVNKEIKEEEAWKEKDSERSNKSDTSSSKDEKISSGRQNTGNNLNSNRSAKENAIDLTKKEGPNSRTSSINSGGEVQSSGKEVLKLDQHKIEINLKNTEDHLNSENHDELIAKDMGTTANILVIKNNYLYLANVGDSMAVMFKNGAAVRLNQEHKTTLPSEFTRISKSGAKIINNRIEGRLNLTRAIGDLAFKNNPNLKFYEQSVTAYPEITKMKITKDIDFIIMACDGVWDCVDAQKLCEHISIKLKSKNKISSIIADLFDQIISKTNNSKY